MFTLARQSFARRAFSTSAARNDLAKLTLIGRMGNQPSIRTNRNGKEYAVYSVCTNSQGPEGVLKPTWHNITFHGGEGTRNFLTTIPKGSLVYVESQFDVREPEQGADPSTFLGQKQQFLRHEFIRVLKRGRVEGEGEFETTNSDA